MSAVLKRLHRDIDELLEAWARWRRGAVRPPTGGYGNPLAALVAEGASLGRGTRGQAEAEKLLRDMRNAIDLQIAMLSACLAGLMGDEALDAVARRAQLADQVKTLKDARRRIPRTAEHLPWASLIQGSGHRPDPEYPEEEAVESAVRALTPELQRVVNLEYLVYGTQEMKAARLRMTRRQFQWRLGEALRVLASRLK